MAEAQTKGAGRLPPEMGEQADAVTEVQGRLGLARDAEQARRAPTQPAPASACVCSFF